MPEVARILMLSGADLIAWPSSFSSPLGAEKANLLARCRADENRLFLVHANPVRSSIVSPNGAFLAQALPGEEMAISALVNLAFSRFKDMAPGTNPVLNRTPSLFKELTS